MIYFTLPHTIYYNEGQSITLLTVIYRAQDCKYIMESINPMVSIAHVYVKDRNYTVCVTMNSSNRRLHIFKYSEESLLCEYEVFDDYEEACDYLNMLL